MPKRRGTPFSLKTTAGYTQRECSQPPLSGGRRAPPSVPGRIPLREEAELFLGVTEASAEPTTGAILLEPSNISKTEGSSPQLPESDIGISRLGGMGRLSDGFSHLTSDSDHNPLRTNNLESLPQSAPSPSGDIPIEANLATSGFDPTTNGFDALSEMEIDERQEGAQETTNTDTINPSFTNDLTVLNANNVSHPFTDIHKKVQNISVPRGWIKIKNGIKNNVKDKMQKETPDSGKITSVIGSSGSSKN